MHIKKRTLSILSLGFGILVIAIVCYVTFSEETITHILAFNLAFLALAILFRFIALGFWGARITCMGGTLGYRVPFLHSINMVLAGLFAGTFTPGQLGGEAVRIHELHAVGVSVGDSTAIVLVERVLDGVVLTILGIGSLILLHQLWTTFPISILVLMAIAWIFMLSILIIPFLAVRYPCRTRYILLRIIDWIARRYPSQKMKKIGEDIGPEIDNFFSCMTLFTQTARKGLLFGGICTFAFWICEFMVASIILMGLGYPPSIAESFFFQIIIAIVMMIPSTPGSTGVTELATTSLYTLLIPVSVVGIFTLIWRFVTFYLNLVLGAVSSLFICRRGLSGGKDGHSCKTIE